MLLNTFKEKTVCLFGICIVAILFASPLRSAEEVKDSPQEEASQDVLTGEQKSPDEYVYLMEGRPDPFEPFIEPKVATKIDPNEIIDDEAELTGMQLFEPGQLTLVAVMLAQGNKIAMVEDVTGKGYIINEGILVGRHGVVSQVTEDQVIVTETAKTRAGKELITTTIMRLHKEE